MAIDWTILHWIQDVFKCEFMDKIMPVFSALGEYGAIWIIIGLSLLISKRYRKVGIIVLLGMLAGVIIGNGIIKNVVARQRPCWIDSSYSLIIKNPKDYSFPSGHTLSSIIAATAITINIKKAGFIVVLLAVLIAFSRLYLYVHFPTDILGGLILGIIIGVTTSWAVNKIIKTRAELNINNK